MSGLAWEHSRNAIFGLAMLERMVPILPIVSPVTERFLGREAATTEEGRLAFPCLDHVALVID